MTAEPKSEGAVTHDDRISNIARENDRAVERGDAYRYYADELHERLVEAEKRAETAERESERLRALAFANCSDPECGQRCALFRGADDGGLLIGVRCSDCGDVFCGSCAKSHFNGPERARLVEQARQEGYERGRAERDA